MEAPNGLEAAAVEAPNGLEAAAVEAPNGREAAAVEAPNGRETLATGPAVPAPAGRFTPARETAPVPRDEA